MNFSAKTRNFLRNVWIFALELDYFLFRNIWIFAPKLEDFSKTKYWSLESYEKIRKTCPITEFICLWKTLESYFRHLINVYKQEFIFLVYTLPSSSFASVTFFQVSQFFWQQYFCWFYAPADFTKFVVLCEFSLP